MSYIIIIIFLEKHNRHRKYNLKNEFFDFILKALKGIHAEIAKTNLQNRDRDCNKVWVENCFETLTPLPTLTVIATLLDILRKY